MHLHASGLGNGCVIFLDSCAVHMSCLLTPTSPPFPSGVIEMLLWGSSGSFLVFVGEPGLLRLTASLRPVQQCAIASTPLPADVTAFWSSSRASRLGVRLVLCTCILALEGHCDGACWSDKEAATCGPCIVARSPCSGISLESAQLSVVVCWHIELNYPGFVPGSPDGLILASPAVYSSAVGKALTLVPCEASLSSDDWSIEYALNTLLLYVQLQLAIFFRTFVLFYLLAIAHLLPGCALSRKDTNIGTRPRFGFAHASEARPYFGRSALLLTYSQFALQGVLCTATKVTLIIRRVKRLGIRFMNAVLLRALEFLQLALSLSLVPTSLCGAPVMELQTTDVKFLVCLYEFQRSTSFLGVWSYEAETVGEFIALLLEEQIGGAGSKTVIPVSPQPRSHGVAVIIADVWNIALLQCPVLIQVYAGQQISFVGYFVGRVASQDVRLCAGHLWPPGAKIYVGDSKGPLPEDEFFSPYPGLLIRIAPPSIIPGIPVDLQTRLSSRMNGCTMSTNGASRLRVVARAEFVFLGFGQISSFVMSTDARRLQLSVSRFLSSVVSSTELSPSVLLSVMYLTLLQGPQLLGLSLALYHRLSNHVWVSL